MSNADIFIEMIRLAEQIGEVTSAVLSTDTFDKAMNGFCAIELTMRDGCKVWLRLDKGERA